MDKKSLKAYQDADWLRQKYWGEGLSLQKIGRLCGINSVTILNWMKRHGIARRKPREAQMIGKRLLSKEELESLYWEDRLSLEQIGQPCGVCQWTVLTWMKMHGIPRRRCWEAQMRGKKYLSKKELESLYRGRRMTMKEIAELCGVCLVTIRNWLIKYGIPIRTLSEARTGSRHTEGTKQKMSRAHRGARNPAWQGGRVEDSYGRIHIHAPQNRMADSNGYVFEHRLVMSEHLGRPLTADEVVHHINEDVGDNRLENLMLFASNVEHIKFHARMRKSTSNRDNNEGDNAT